jgi:excisionase family DNA binding protein
MSSLPQSAPKGVDSLFTVSQAAERLGCSRRLVYNEIARGNLEARRLGGTNQIRIPAEALEEFQRSTSTEEWINRWVAAAPPLTAIQKVKLATLLKPVREFLRAEAVHP